MVAVCLRNAPQKGSSICVPPVYSSSKLMNSRDCLLYVSSAWVCGQWDGLHKDVLNQPCSMVPDKHVIQGVMKDCN